MRKKLQVFISSTYLDLKEDRQIAVESILSAGHIPAGMELFTAGNESQWEVIKRWIDESDIYMLILGGRYGSIEATSKLSYIELEYDYAVKKKKPFFALVMNDDLLNERLKSCGKDILELDNPDKYKDFKKKVLSKICKFYSDYKDIKIAVYETLKDFNDRYNLSGWVSGRELPDVSLYTKEIEDLKEKVKRLYVEKNELAKRINELTSKPTLSCLDSVQEDFDKRIERILKLLNYSLIESQPNIEWFEGEGDGEGVEEKSYSIINTMEDFYGYYVYDDNKNEQFYIISFVCYDEDIEINSVIKDLRVYLTTLPECSTTFNFLIINRNIDENAKERLYKYFNNLILEVQKEKRISLSFDIWASEEIKEKEKELLLDF